MMSKVHLLGRLQAWLASSYEVSTLFTVARLNLICSCRAKFSRIIIIGLMRFGPVAKSIMILVPLVLYTFLKFYAFYLCYAVVNLTRFVKIQHSIF